MSGHRYLLDTNAVIALLQGNEKILRLLRSARWIGISIMTYLEFLSYPAIKENDKRCFNDLIQRIDIINLEKDENDLLDFIVALRQKFRIKMPDAIIAATAITHKAILVTADKQFGHIKPLRVQDF
jgi:hypothetical protein